MATSVSGDRGSGKQSARRASRMAEVSAAPVGQVGQLVPAASGSRETASLREIVATSKAALPGAGLVIVEGGDHGTTFTTPEFRTAVVDFLKAHPE
ncbi:MAG TPA: hypothetical protein VD866_27540 [Urbifossiella sp.]|nr:hypothetical protein [Urbifossiella sp.]